MTCPTAGDCSQRVVFLQNANRRSGETQLRNGQHLTWDFGLTSDSADYVVQVLVVEVAVEQSVRHVGVNVLIVVAGAVDNSRQSDLRRGVDQERVREEQLVEEPLDLLPEYFCVRIEGRAPRLQKSNEQITSGLGKEFYTYWGWLLD